MIIFAMHCRSGVRLAKLYEVLTGSLPLLGKTAKCEPPLFLHPVTDQQRMVNMSTVLASLASVGAVPPEGKVWTSLMRGGNYGRVDGNGHRVTLFTVHV